MCDIHLPKCVHIHGVQDRARLELLEVSGTAHADEECHSCSLLSSPGSQRCLSCSRNQYLGTWLIWLIYAIGAETKRRVPWSKLGWYIDHIGGWWSICFYVHMCAPTIKISMDDHTTYIMFWPWLMCWYLFIFPISPGMIMMMIPIQVMFAFFLVPGDGCLSDCKTRYAELDDAGVIRCSKCPAGTWAPAASVGRDSCRTRRQCNAQDVQVLYLAANASMRSSSICRNNHTNIRVRWRKPKTCKSEIGAKELAGIRGGALTPQACPPCQPNQWRPKGGACVNRPAARCSPPLYAVPMSVIKYWHSWPKNVTSWIWGRSVSEDHPHAWQLMADGRAAVVGSAYLGEEVDEFSDQALLTLDVDLTTSSDLIFGLEEEPLGAWGQGGALYVDHQPREAEMVTESGTTSVWKLKLNPGWHWITWVWRYKGPQPEEQAADTGVVVGQGSGLRLLNISVTHVRGGPPVSFWGRGRNAGVITKASVS